MNREFQDQLDGARNIFFGFLKGIDNKFNIELPEYVYHYTSLESFYSMVESNTIRMYTISNFEDKLERKIPFEIEQRIKATITDKATLKKYDIAQVINNALSQGHVFVQSNTPTSTNPYLWKNYAEQGKGICLRISVKEYLSFLEENLDDFKLLPNYLKCCFVSYDNQWANEFMDMLFPAVQATNAKLGGAGYLVWFFFLEYWRNLIKVAEPYEKEQEFRFAISDNYSLFLYLCGLLAKWGHFTTDNHVGLSEAFFEESQARVLKLQKTLSFSSIDNKKFTTLPFSKIVTSVIIGPNSRITKTEISKKTKFKIKKSEMERSFIRL